VGPEEPEVDPDPGFDHNALELAAFYGHHEVFGLKAVRLDPKHERAKDLMRMACHGDKADLLKRLLDMGAAPRS
jgi:hypothetical protein